MTEDTTPSPEYRRSVVARFGHFRVDRVWFRTKRPNDPGDKVFYSFVFEVDGEGEFSVGWSEARAILSHSELRFRASLGASTWRHTQLVAPKVRRPYFRRRIDPTDTTLEVTPEEWIQDSAFRMPGQPTIDVDEAAALIEGAMHELAETETDAGKYPRFWNHL